MSPPGDEDEASILEAAEILVDPTVEVAVDSPEGVAPVPVADIPESDIAPEAAALADEVVEPVLVVEEEIPPAVVEEESTEPVDEDERPLPADPGSPHVEPDEPAGVQVLNHDEPLIDILDETEIIEVISEAPESVHSPEEGSFEPYPDPFVAAGADMPEHGDIDEVGDKRSVQFAPGTPEPRPTQRKKKSAKGTKIKKKRTPLPAADEGPSEIIVDEAPADTINIPLAQLESEGLVEPRVVDEPTSETISIDVAEDLVQQVVDVQEADDPPQELVPEPETLLELEPVQIIETIEDPDTAVKPKKKSEKKSSKSRSKRIESTMAVFEAPPPSDAGSIERLRKKGKKYSSKSKSKEPGPEPEPAPVPAPMGLGIDFGGTPSPPVLDETPAEVEIVEVVTEEELPIPIDGETADDKDETAVEISPLVDDDPPSAPSASADDAGIASDQVVEEPAKGNAEAEEAAGEEHEDESAEAVEENGVKESVEDEPIPPDSAIVLEESHHSDTDESDLGVEQGAVVVDIDLNDEQFGGSDLSLEVVPIAEEKEELPEETQTLTEKPDEEIKEIDDSFIDTTAFPGSFETETYPVPDTSSEFDEMELVALEPSDQPESPEAALVDDSSTEVIEKAPSDVLAEDIVPDEVPRAEFEALVNEDSPPPTEDLVVDEALTAELVPDETAIVVGDEEQLLAGPTSEAAPEVAAEEAVPIELNPEPVADPPAAEAVADMEPPQASEEPVEVVAEAEPEPEPIDEAKEVEPIPVAVDTPILESEAPTEPAPVPAAEVPPSPTLSRRSHDKQKADRWRRTPSKKLPSSDKKASDKTHSSKPTSSRTTNYKRHRSDKQPTPQRTPEEEEERRRRRERKRAEETARYLADERRRADEEEIRMLREEAKRAARKAAAAEAVRLVREEAAAAAKKEVERRRRRRDSVRESERPRSQRESKGLFGRSSGGGGGEPKSPRKERSSTYGSRHGDEERPRSSKVAVPVDEPIVDDNSPRDIGGEGNEGPAAPSGSQQGSSSRKHRHRRHSAEEEQSESQHRRRDTDRRDRDGESKSRSKRPAEQQKPRSFLGSLLRGF